MACKVTLSPGSKAQFELSELSSFHILSTLLDIVSVDSMSVRARRFVAVEAAMGRGANVAREATDIHYLRKKSSFHRF